jgi:hypothetical protein
VNLARPVEGENNDASSDYEDWALGASCPIPAPASKQLSITTAIPHRIDRPSLLFTTFRTQ